jgi:hypothetical protein
LIIDFTVLFIDLPGAVNGLVKSQKTSSADETPMMV